MADGAPLCGHRLPSTQLTVRKEGPNKGRRFWKCAQPDKCAFFQWDGSPQRAAPWRAAPPPPAAAGASSAAHPPLPTVTLSASLARDEGAEPELHCHFDWNAELVGAMRAFGRARWCAETRTWRAPLALQDELIERLRALAHVERVPPRVTRALAAAPPASAAVLSLIHI